MQALSLGPEGGTFYRWVYLDGSTWCLLAKTRSTRQLVGWSCITKEESLHTALGVFVHSAWRGHGLATVLVQVILGWCDDKKYIRPGDTIMADETKYSRYPQLLETEGYRHVEWQ